MAEVILAVNDKEIASLIPAKLKADYGASILVRSSSADVLSMLEILPDVKLVIVSNVIVKDQISKKICENLIFGKLEHNKNVEVLILGEKNTSYKNAQAIHPKTDWLDIVKYIAFVLGHEKEKPIFKLPEEKKEIPNPVSKTPDELKTEDKTTVFQIPKGGLKELLKDENEKKAVEIQKNSYKKINFKFFTYFEETELPSDLFTRIKKGNDFEYSIKVQKGTKFTRVELERLATRGLKEFYVKEEDRDLIFKLFHAPMLNAYAQTKENELERMRMLSLSHDQLVDIFSDEYFSFYGIDLIKESLKSFDLVIKNPDAIDVYLGYRTIQKFNYGFSHAYFSCVLINRIIDQFSFSKDFSKNKLLYLSFFHDLTLNREKLIKLHHNFYSFQNELTNEDKELILKHADKTATILEKIVKAPHELSQLIREHHGIKNGLNISPSLSISIHPLSMTFMVVESVVARYLDILEKLPPESDGKMSELDINTLFAEMKKKYDKMTYLEAANILHTFFLENFLSK